MANIARVQTGHLVLDPFLGTASILVRELCSSPHLIFSQVATTHFGGLSLGFDIDIRVLRGNMHAGHDPLTDSAPLLLEERDEENSDTRTMTITGAEVTEGGIEKRHRSEEWKEIERSTRKKNKKTKKGQDSDTVQRSIEENFRFVELELS
jgi:hypothetical protein